MARRHVERAADNTSLRNLTNDSCLRHEAVNGNVASLRRQRYRHSHIDSPAGRGKKTSDASVTQAFDRFGTIDERGVLLKLLLAAALMVFGLAAPAAAQSAAVVVGSIVDQTGAPLAGVRVTIRGVADRIGGHRRRGRLRVSRRPGRRLRDFRRTERL